MFRKVHYKLTLLFTGITSFILIVMSVCYLYLSENNLEDSQFLSFQSDMNTILTNMEQQTVITHEWLSKIEANGKYQIFILDNGVEFLFQNKEKNVQKESLFQRIQDYYYENFKEQENDSSFTATHKEFLYQDKDISGQNYFSCVAALPKQSGNMEVIILSSIAHLESQIWEQRILFFIINCTGIIFLFLFSYYFTKILLKPIEKNQKEQVEFIAAASHELRTPLAVILSSLSACQKATEEEQKTFFHVMENEGIRMSNLVQDMLTLANADNHSWRVQCEQTELDTLVLDTYEAFWPIAKEKNRRLSVTLPEAGIAPCSCDRERIKQVLAILLNNALSYTKVDGIVQLKLSEQEKYFEITVSDNGIGIPENEKIHIFKRFYRIDSSRNRKNHFGLGLCIASEIILTHQGSILVTDTPGGGSTFHIRLKHR